ncbi:hypothetical protein BpHYR1_023927 [Brachionus plicatilis]|uniref:Uncharacterized protein n=1 Tax=Brachionus plicatilis TaxID=10195 RepID=A0A3M7S8Q7_BRAPC|nr:hypothetical protein BpHYR1_023927 [Brachionus plicatilis]
MNRKNTLTVVDHDILEKKLKQHGFAFVKQQNRPLTINKRVGYYERIETNADLLGQTNRLNPIAN